MTAVIAYQTVDGVHLLSDGLAYGPEGEPVAFVQKVQILAHQSAAFVARGPSLFGGLLAVIAGQCQGDFETLAASFGGMCRSAHQAMLEAAKAGTPLAADPDKVDVILIGVSQSEFVAFSVSSYEDEGLPPWTMKLLQGDSALVFASPMNEQMVGALQRQGLDIWAERVSVEAHGLALMREQRRSCTIVGGFCQLTTVMRSGIFTSILERWPIETSRDGQVAA